AWKPAYVDDHDAMTYGELEERARRMSSAMREIGVHREERVLLLMHDNNDWPVSFLGCLHAGVVPVCVNTLLTVDDYAYVLEHSRAQGALVSRAEGELPVGASDLRGALEGFPVAESAAPTHREDIAFWLYSSGSTGRPKGAVHTHANPYWTAELYG